jgi:hypothetical protein
MPINPVDQKPTGTFAAEDMNKAPETFQRAASAGQYKLGLAGSQGQLGWMGQNSSGWAILVPDEANAVTLELYPYQGVNYYRILGQSSYLSVSNNAYVGFYAWSGASGWTKNGSKLKSGYNGQNLSLYSKDNGYLYAWDAYTQLDVTFKEA